MTETIEDDASLYATLLENTRNDPLAWNKWVRTHRPFKERPVAIEAGDFSGFDFVARKTYGLDFENCDFTGIQVGASFPLRRLADLDGNIGIVVIPKIPPKFLYETTEQYGDRRKRHNMARSVILINSGRGPVVFQTTHRTLGEIVENGRATQILQPNQRIKRLIAKLADDGWGQPIRARNLCLDWTVPRDLELSGATLPPKPESPTAALAAQAASGPATGPA